MKWIAYAILFMAFPKLDILQGSEWKDRWMAEMDTIDKMPLAQQIERLGIAVRAKSTDGRQPTDDQLAVANRAVVLLTSIPGHAEYYRDRILRAQQHLKTVWNDHDLAGPAYVDYRREQGYGFQTLSHLPGPETIRVYGELMSNRWVPPGNDSAPLSEKLTPLSVIAVVEIAKHPIRNPPFKDSLTKSNVSDAHAAWSQWFEEIKSGRRTFLFEGDPVEYDLNGPAPAQKIESIARDTKRERDRSVGLREVPTNGIGTTESVAESQSSGVSVPMLAAGALVLGALAWYVSRHCVLRHP